MAYGDLKVRNLIWNTGSGDNTVVLSTLATQSYVTTGFAPKANPAFTGTATGVNLTLSGNLTVNGTQTIINTQTLDVEDKQIEIGKVSSPSDTTADQGGWKLKGATDKTFLWVNATDAWTSSEHIHLGDNKKLLLGTGSDIQIYHNGSTSFLTDGIGDLRIRGDAVKIQSASGENSARFIANGAVELYYDNSKKFETTSSGIAVTGDIDVANGSISLRDNYKLNCGLGSDLQIFHSGSENFIRCATSASRLYIDCTEHLRVRHLDTNGTNDESMIYAKGDGAVELYYDGSKKLETTSGGINVTGAINVNGAALSTAPQITATASGAITAGDRVIVNANGTVTKVGLVASISSNSAITSSVTGYTNWGYTDATEWTMGYDTQYGVQLTCMYKSNGSAIELYRGGWSSNQPTFTYVGNLSDSSNVVQSYAEFQIVLDTAQNKHLVFFGRNYAAGGDQNAKAAILTVNSATSVTIGNTVNIGSGYYHPKGVFDSNVNKFITAYIDSSGNVKARACYINGSTVTTHSEITLATGALGNSLDKVTLAFDSSNNKTVATYTTGNGALKSKVLTCAANGTLTAGTEVNLSTTGYGPKSTFDSSSGKVALCYRGSSALEVHVGTVSGTSISWGSSYSEYSGYGNNSHLIFSDPNSDKLLVTYGTSSSDGRELKGKLLTVSGTTVSSYLMVEPQSGHGLSNNTSAGKSAEPFSYYAISFDVNENRWGYTYRDFSGGGSKAASFRTGTVQTNLTTENYIGIAAASASDSASATIDVSGATNSNQSSLTAGQKYFVQNNGSLGLTAATPKVFAGTAVSATKIIVNDQQPSTPEGGLMHVQGFSAANSAYITFENLTSTDISSYLVRFNGITFTSGPSKIMAQLQFNGTWEQNSEYMTRTKIFELGTTSSQTYSGSSAADHFYLQDQGGHQVNGELHLPMCSLTNNNTDEAIKYVWGTMQASNYRNDFHGRCDSTASRSNQISGIRFRSNKSNDNIGVSGRIDLYKYTY